MIHATFTQDAQKGSVTMEMQGHALTGVGRNKVRTGTAPHPALEGHLPPGEDKEI